MHLVIDGYNLIRRSPVFRAAEAEDLEMGRQVLIEYLEIYRCLKRRLEAKQIKITVVFDGERSFHLSTQKERVKGINVVYSGLGEKADDVIKRMVQRDPNLVVVTSDREIVNFAERCQAVSIEAEEFLAKLEMAYYMDLKGAEEEEYAERHIAPSKKGPSFRLSKRKKKKQRILKKL